MSETWRAVAVGAAAGTNAGGFEVGAAAGGGTNAGGFEVGAAAGGGTKAGGFCAPVHFFYVGSICIQKKAGCGGGPCDDTCNFFVNT